MRTHQPKSVHLADYRPPDFFIDETEMRVDLFEDRAEVVTNMTLRRNPEVDGTPPLVLDGTPDLATESIEVDGETLSPNAWQINTDREKLTILNMPTRFRLQTKVQIRPQDNTRLEGLYRSGNMFCTQCEAEGFRNITWYLDRPDVLSRFTTTLCADKKACPVLLANGNPVASGQADSRHWVTWEDPFRKPAYLFAMVAGDLEQREDFFVTQSGRRVTLRIFSEAHNIDKVDWAMDSLKRSMRWDEQVYGREYDLQIFMIVAVESFNMGAMENKGLNIFNTACVLASPDTTTDSAYQQIESIVAHEYFHNWSGNRVTCRDWFQLSLKEGFTVFRDQQFSADMGSQTAARINDVATLRAAQFAEDAGPMAHPVQPDNYIEINNFYTATVYEKGAEVVRMIHRLLGRKKFRAGADLYFSRHDGEAVTVEHFVAAMEDANEADLHQFRLWYRQAGTPRLTVESRYHADQQALDLKVTQEIPPTPGQPDKQPMHIPLAVGMLSPGGQDMPFQVAEKDLAALDESDSHHTAVLSLTQAQQTFRLTGLAQKPLPSLLRQFSAPVRLFYDYSRSDLAFLLRHDSDGFNRWEAGQQLATQVLTDLIQATEKADRKVDPELVSAIGALLTEAIERHEDSTFDRSLMTDMLALPSEAWLAEMFEPVNVIAIHEACETVYQQLGEAHSALLLKLYRLNHETEAPWQPDIAGISRRAMANTALHYLMKSSGENHLPLCLAQAKQARNMTDYHAAVKALVHHPNAAVRAHRPDILARYRSRYADNELVLDQWFSLQATDPHESTIAAVKELQSRPDFKPTVPNRVRSLVGAFAFRNPVQFHRLDGQGYAFVSDQILHLDALNPQMAARLATAFSKWRKFDTLRQDLMSQQLRRILEASSLSRGVFEVVSKNLDN